ncbi:MAG: hypothetical protein ACNA8L_02030 [Luteolibacter sp.]
MSDSENAPAPETPASAKGIGDLLANFALGPAWARADAGKSKSRTGDGGKTRQRSSEENRDRGDRRRDKEPRRDGAEKGGRRFTGNRRDDRQRRDFPQEEFVPPAPGVRLSVVPDPAALHLIAKEVHHVARVYSLFDIATTLLADRHRCRAVFEVDENHPPMFRGKLDDSLFLTRGEAVAHLWQSRALRDQFLDEETVEVDPPSGNFVAVAKCGISGEWLGPPNFHTYQTNLRRLHRERFASMPFDAYNARVRTERGEEAVNAWLESMKKLTRWRPKNAAEDAPWITDIAEAPRALEAAAFDQAFETTRRADVPAGIAAANLSPGLLSTLKRSGSHARKHPAMLIPAVCKALEAEHLPVFKRKGKLFTGPARPLALPADAVLAERPGRMVEWIRANTPAKLEGLWQAVLPEGGTAPPAEYAADLFWMLQQGHILLFTDDTLVVQEHHEPTPPAKKKAKKKKPTQIQAVEASETSAPEPEPAVEPSEAEQQEPEAQEPEPQPEPPSEARETSAPPAEDPPPSDRAE